MATAFAIFCADDGSLTFYKRDTVPSVGEEFEGKVVGAVYTWFETSRYSSSTIPWADNMSTIVSVSFVDEISPKYTNSWFYGASVMTSFDATNLNTSNVIEMNSMFRDCSGLTSLDLSSFNTSQLTSCTNMFQNCRNLISLDISSFCTSKIKNLSSMFYDCNNLTSIDVSNFDTSNITKMNYTFSGCSSLTSLDLSNFNTLNVTSTNSMFSNCTNLTTIYVSDLWTIAVVTSSIGSIGMFRNCTSLVGAIPFDSTITDATHANYQTGYLTYKFYADYLKNRFVIDGAELYDIGNKIRTLTGGKEGMTPAQMAEALGNYIDSLLAST